MLLHTAAVRSALPSRNSSSLLRIARLPSRQLAATPLRSPATRRFYSQQQQNGRSQDSFFNKLREALKNTKTEWYAIPVGVGIGVVGFTQIRKNARGDPAQPEVASTAAGDEERPAGEKKIRPMRSW